MHTEDHEHRRGIKLEPSYTHVEASSSSRTKMNATSEFAGAVEMWRGFSIGFDEELLEDYDQWRGIKIPLEAAVAERDEVTGGHLESGTTTFGSVSNSLSAYSASAASWLSSSWATDTTADDFDELGDQNGGDKDGGDGGHSDWVDLGGDKDEPAARDHRHPHQRRAAHSEPAFERGGGGGADEADVLDGFDVWFGSSSSGDDNDANWSEDGDWSDDGDDALQAPTQTQRKAADRLSAKSSQHRRGTKTVDIEVDGVRLPLPISSFAA